MSAKRIIAVAEAMMRQSRRAGGVVDAVTHSYVEMPLRLGGSVGNGCETGRTPGKLGLLARLIDLRRYIG